MRKRNIMGVILVIALALSLFAFGSPSMAQTSSDEKQEWVDLWFDGQPVTTYDSGIVPGVADAKHPHVAYIVHFDKSGTPVEGKWFVVTKKMEAVADDVFNKQEAQGVKPSPIPGSSTDTKTASVTATGTRTAHARQTMRCVATIRLTYQESWQTFLYNGTKVTQVAGQGGWYYAEPYTGWRCLGSYWSDLGPTLPASYHRTYSYGDFWNWVFGAWQHRHQVWSIAYGSGAVAGSYVFSGSAPPGYSLVRESWYN